MTKTNRTWRIATNLIPQGAALIRYEGQYWLCHNYCLYAVDQAAAEAFAATL